MYYDYIIVGSGLFGAVFANQMRKKKKKCLVLERRSNIGGNTYTEDIEDIQVHMYGPHIFHTNQKAVWRYVNQFAEFNHFIYSPIANYKGEVYNLPFNMNTFSKMWGITKPEEAIRIIERQRAESGIDTPQNLEEQAISLVGKDIYEKLIKGYTEKQWGRSCTQLPVSIIKRLPVRFIYDNNYYNHPYQGIPVGGYTLMIKNMLGDTEVKLETDYLKDKDFYDRIGDKILYTGPIDEYFDFCFGELEYRGLRFEHEIMDVGSFQGVAGMNYTDKETPYTRIIEHKHFEFGKGKPNKTVITREYPLSWKRGEEPYYPVNDEYNNKLYEKYRARSEKEKNVFFGGRLGLYQYLDMDNTIGKALALAETEG